MIFQIGDEIQIPRENNQWQLAKILSINQNNEYQVYWYFGNKIKSKKNNLNPYYTKNISV